MRCIFCKNLMTPNTTSFDHIVPASLGGQLMLENVCKTCNNFLESSFESDISKMLVVKILKQHFRIFGRSNKPCDPWDNQIVEIADGYNVSLAEGGLPRCSNKPKISIGPNNHLHVRYCPRLGSSFQEIATQIYKNIPKSFILERKLTRKTTINRIINALQTNKSNIAKECSVNIPSRSIQKLFIKVAYEIAAIEFGWEWIYKCGIAKVFSDFLLQDAGEVSSCVKFCHRISNYLHTAFLLPHNPSIMYVQIFGFPVVIPIFDSKCLLKPAHLSKDYVFCNLCLDGTVNESNSCSFENHYRLPDMG